MSAGTAVSTRGTTRCPITPTERTCRRFGVTVRTTLTWFPGTCFSRAGGTRNCSTPPRVCTISMPRPMDVLTELALDEAALRLAVLKRQPKARRDEASEQRDGQHPCDGSRYRVRPSVDGRHEDEDRRDDQETDDGDTDGDVTDADDLVGRIALQHPAGLHELLALPPRLTRRSRRSGFRLDLPHLLAHLPDLRPFLSQLRPAHDR